MWLIKWTAIIGICVVGIVACSTSDWYVAHKNKMAAERAEDAKPQIVSRGDDGCAVYTFKAGGDWRYFTRCGDDTVTTERNYSVACGKARCSRAEQIETIPQQQEPRP
jgi:hypothetical protein